jgi:hypothetical protein
MKVPHSVSADLIKSIFLFVRMTDSTASPRRNPEENSSIDYREKCLNIGNHILLIIYRFLSDCLACRLISFIFTLQAGIIWLGCK